MKSMTCKQLGGACDLVFKAESFDEIAKLSQHHGMEMHRKNDPSHLAAMQKMQALMQEPDEMAKWFDARKQEFESLPED